MMEYRATGPDASNKFHVEYVIPGSNASKIYCECSSYAQAIEAAQVVARGHGEGQKKIALRGGRNG